MSNDKVSDADSINPGPRWRCTSISALITSSVPSQIFRPSALPVPSACRGIPPE